MLTVVHNIRIPAFQYWWDFCFSFLTQDFCYSYFQSLTNYSLNRLFRRHSVSPCFLKITVLLRVMCNLRSCMVSCTLLPICFFKFGPNISLFCIFLFYVLMLSSLLLSLRTSCRIIDYILSFRCFCEEILYFYEITNPCSGSILEFVLFCGYQFLKIQDKIFSTSVY